tara:strand:+ start:613 stop:945 length:333 start_codon:yes stop_codon:yes gene_type:complete
VYILVLPSKNLPTQTNAAVDILFICFFFIFNFFLVILFFLGPFGGGEMAEWYQAGYLAADLRLSSSPDGERYPIAAIVGESTGTSAKDIFATDLNVAEVRALRDCLSRLL